MNQSFGYSIFISFVSASDTLFVFISGCGICWIDIYYPLKIMIGHFCNLATATFSKMSQVIIILFKNMNVTEKIVNTTHKG